MADTLGTLVVRLAAETGELKAGMDSAVKDTGAATTQMTQMTQQMTQQMHAAIDKAQSDWFNQNNTLRETNAVMFSASDSVQKLLDKYDPLGTKLRSLQADFHALNQAASSGTIGSGQDVAVDKTYAALNAELAKTKGLMAAAGAGTVEAGVSMAGLGLNTQMARRELMQLGREAMTGDVSRMPLTFGSLVTHSNLLQFAMSATGASILGTAAAAGVMIYAFVKGSEEATGYNKALLMTGDASGTTSAAMGAMASTIAQGSATQGKAAEALTALAATGKVASGNFVEFTQVAIDMEHATGQSVGDTVKHFAELGVDPVKASLKLNDSMGYLTLSTYDQIKAAVELGDKALAASIAQKSYADALETISTQVKSSQGTMAQGWDMVATAAKKAGDAMLNVGRPDTNQIKLDVVNAQIAALQNGTSGPTGEGKADPLNQFLAKFAPWQAAKAKQLETLGAESAALQGVILGKQADADATAKGIAIQNAGITATDQLTAANDRAKTNIEKAAAAQNAYTKALTDRYAADVQAGNDPSTDPKLQADQIYKTRDAIEAQYASTTKLGVAKKLLADAYDATQKKAGEFIQTLSKETDEVGLNAIQKKMVEASIVSLTLKTEEERAAVMGAALAWANANRVADESKKATDAAKVASENYTKQIDALGKARDTELGKLDSEIVKQTEHNATVGMSKSQIDAYKQAQEEQTTAELQGQQQAIDLLLTKGQIVAENGVIEATVGDQARGIYELELDRLNKIIAKRQQLAGSYATGAEADAANEMLKTEQNAAKQVGQSLSDEIMRGGKSGAQYLVDLFRTLVLAPLVKVIVNPIAQVVTGMVGTMGTAAAGGAAGTAGTGMLGSLGGSAGFSAFSGGLAGFGQAAGVTMSNGLVSGFGANMANIGNLASGGSYATALGAAIPYVAVAVAAYALLKGGGLSQTGQGITGSFSGTGFTGNSYAEMTNKPGLLRGWLGANDNVYKNLSPLDAATQYQLSTAFDAMKKQTTAYADALGLNADKVAGYSKDITLAFGTDQAANQKLVADTLTGIAADLANGVFGTSGTTTRTVTSSVVDQPGGWQGNGQDGSYIEATWKDITTTVTEGTSVVSQYAHGLETADQTLARLATSLVGVNEMFKDLGYTLMSKDLTGASKASNLADAFGGLANAQTAMNGYYQAFYSAAEQTANLTRNTADAFAALNIPMPAVNAGLRDWYRGIVDNLGAQDMGVKANADAYAAAVNLYGAIDKLAPAATAAADATKAAADALKIFTDTANTNAGLQSTLYGLMDAANGTTLQQAFDRTNTLADITSKLGVSTSQTTIDLQNQIYVQQDLADATAKAAATLATNTGLQDQLDVLLGTRTQTQVDRTNTLAGMTDATTIKLQNQVWAQQDLAAATQAATQATFNWAQWAADGAASYTALMDKWTSAISSAYSKVQSSLAAVGNAVQALADKAKSTADALQGSKDNISNALFAAQDKVTQLQQQAAAGLATFTKSIDDFLYTINPATSSTASLSSLKAQLSATAVLAAGGDTNAQGRLIGEAQAADAAAKASSASALEYARSEAFIRTTLLAVKTAVDPAPIVGAVAVAIVDPMADARAALLKAQQDVIDFTALANATGAKTINTAETTEQAITRLSRAYQLAQQADTNAQNNYHAALKATSDLTFTTAGTLDALNLALAAYDQANRDFAKTMYDAGVATGFGVNEWVTQLGLAGAAAAAFVAALATAQQGITHVAIPPTPASIVPLPTYSATDTRVLAAYASVGRYGVGTDITQVDQKGLDYWANALDSGALSSSDFSRVFLGSVAAYAGPNSAAYQFAIDQANSYLTSGNGLPQFATGTNYLQSDGPIFAHAGEEIKSRPYVDLERNARNETNALLQRLLASNKDLKDEITKLKKPLDVTANATDRSKDLAEQVTIGGLSVQTRAVGA